MVDADATLRFPDFRAEERTFALIAQLAGRAGRGGTGACWCRRSRPQARAIVHAAAHDSDGFLAGELERRRALGYPPFSHLIRIVCSCPQAPAVHDAAQALRLELERRLAGDGGDGSAGERGGARPGDAVSPARARARRCSCVKARSSGGRPCAPSGEAVHALAGRARTPGVSFSVDVDPQ